MAEKRPISAQGLEDIKAQIDEIVKVERAQIIADIEEARSHGDLRENAEYHAAKDKQGMIEAKLVALNEILANSEVLEYDKTKSDVVQFGATVTYVNLDSDEKFVWQILGPDEADSSKKKISITSPVGKALTGKTVGDVTTILAPKGEIEVEILKIEYR